MTKNANRNNIKSTPRLIAVVMVLFCLFTTRANHCFGRDQFPRSYSIAYSRAGFEFPRHFKNGFFKRLFLGSPAGFGFSIVAAICFSLFGFTTFSRVFTNVYLPFVSFSIIFTSIVSTIFAIVLMPIFICAVLVKFSEWFDLFAIKTSFCYDMFNHNQLLYSWFRLGPITAHTVVGSFYYNH